VTNFNDGQESTIMPGNQQEVTHVSEKSKAKAQELTGG